MPVLVIAVTIVVLAGFGLGLWRATRPPTVPSVAAPDSWGSDPDDLRWDAEAAELLHLSLPKVQDTAAKWAQSITALLGVFSVVAFLKGPQSLAELRPRWTITVICLIGAAGLAAAVAVYAAALAAQGSPRWVDQLDGWQLKVLHKTFSRHAARLLGLSRVLAVAAALILLTAIIVAALAQTLDPKPSPEPAAGQHALGPVDIRGDDLGLASPPAA